MVLISGNNFNTSHVTVYRMESLSLTIPSTKFQYISCYGLSSLASYDVALNPDFNTSHVTVYQRSGWWINRRKKISIHLMLRFIKRCVYCSCEILCISIHLMLRFIGAEHKPDCINELISIHLMLRFIHYTVKKEWV